MTTAIQLDYGAGGRFAVVTPQGNPTAEAELRILLPPNAAICVARSTSTSPDPERRLIDYFEGLGAALQTFDTLSFDAIAFACTGSSYLVGASRGEELARAAAANCNSPIITATRAIDYALRQCGARKITLIAPYPARLLLAAETYWRSLGYNVVETVRIETKAADTRSIYALSSADAAAAMARPTLSTDAFVLSGTGMPSLAAIPVDSSPPALSSNLCLAWSLLRHAKSSAVDEDRPGDVLRSAKERLDEARRGSPRSIEEPYD